MAARRESADDPQTERPNDNEALQESRERAREVRRKFVREWNRHGSVSDAAKVQAAEVAIDYRDVLIDYREQVTTPEWDQRDLDWIADKVGKTVTRDVNRPGLGRGTEIVERPAFVDVDARRLYQLTKRYDQVWRELGFGADVNSRGDLFMVPDGSEEADE